MREELQTLAIQIGYKELHLAGFRLGYHDKNMTMTISKGNKFFEIKYNEGTDLYDIRKVVIKGIATIVSDKTETGFYWDMLKDEIERFFNFEYVMDGLSIGD